MDFYSSPAIRQQWKPDEEVAAPLPPGTGKVAGLQPGAYGADPRVWALGAGEGASLWPAFFENSYVAIGWGELGNLEQYPTTLAIQTAIKAASDRASEPVRLPTSF